MGMVSERFETAITWDRFAAFDEGVRAAAGEALRRVCGAGQVTCRFTHVYPDGPAPYYTVIGPGRRGAELEQWAAIKQAASEAILRLGGTITHHHAVGRDHRPWYDRERPAGFAAALAAAKAALDPAGVLNPGVLIDPRLAATTLRGARERARAEMDDADPGEEARHRGGRVELEAAPGEVEAARGAVVVVLEELAQGEEVEGQEVPRGVVGPEVAVAVAVATPVDDRAVHRSEHPVDGEEQELPPRRREPEVDERVGRAPGGARHPGRAAAVEPRPLGVVAEEAGLG